MACRGLGVNGGIVHWSFDPVLVHLGPIAIHWYGLLFISAFYLGLMILSRIYREEQLPTLELDNLLIRVLFGTIIGARLVHCFAYEPAYYLRHLAEVPQIWQGGLASHGGAIGLVLVLWWHTRRAPSPQTFLWLLDRVAIPASIGGAFIRVANFLNSEIVGLPTNGQWGVVFEAVDALPRHPVQLYEAVAYLIIFVLLWQVYWRYRRATPAGLLTGLYLVLVFCARFGLEFFKTAQASYESALPLSVGQLLSLPFIVMGAVLIRRALKTRS